MIDVIEMGLIKMSPSKYDLKLLFWRKVSVALKYISLSSFRDGTDILLELKDLPTNSTVKLRLFNFFHFIL